MNKLILGIETSCDETSAAVVKNGRETVSNIISTQIDIHRIYGGVVPEIASRKHMENIGYVVDEALERANVKLNDINAIAVTYGPGLVGALLVGVSYAKALALALNKPLIGVNHIEGHICSNYLCSDLEPPFVCLVVSGGHTHLVGVMDFGKYNVIGRTVDDAAGEAYDKVARTLGLRYPGGPEIDKLAKLGEPDAIPFPRATVADGGFSFSGLKSAVLNYLNKSEMTGVQVNKADVAASFQRAVVEVLVKKAVNGCKELGLNKLALAGGVSANSSLRRAVTEACEENGIAVYLPSPIYCTDNGAMIAACGYYNLINGRVSGLELNAVPSLVL